MRPNRAQAESGARGSALAGCCETDRLTMSASPFADRDKQRYLVAQAVWIENQLMVSRSEADVFLAACLLPDVMLVGPGKAWW